MDRNIELQGTGVFPDVAVGRVILLNTRSHDIIPFYCVLEEEVEREKARFENAISETKRQIEELKHSMADRLSATHLGIFDAHLLVLQDSMLINSTLQRITEDQYNAEHAFHGIVKNLLKQFNEVDDPYLREKSEDLQDISQRVIHNLMRGDKDFPSERIHVTEPSIVVAHVVHPSDLKMLTDNNIIGMATDVGGRTTHTAIIAKALELPTVVGLHNITTTAVDGETIVVDGITGTIILSPDEETAGHYRSVHERKLQIRQELARTGQEEVRTLDGIPINVCANIELEEEIERTRRFRADGIGLYRSEFIFLNVAPLLPTEEQHFAFYSRLAKEVKGDITIRTLDLGGEKFFHEVLESESEQNPVLGLRAVRFCMKRKDIFRTQLRAILRASALSDRIRVMFPLISGTDELRQVLDFMEDVKTEMNREGLPYNPDLKVGIMIEVPSAAEICDLLAQDVDFFSIGTNDLIQYFLAIDRNNDEVNYLYDPLHPGVLRTIHRVIQAGQKAGIEVALCGEMAGNPRYTILLLGLGLQEFSMTPSTIPLVKKIASSVKISDCRKLMQSLMKMDMAEDIAEATEAANRRLIPDYDTILDAHA